MLMLNRYFVRPTTIDRIRGSWIGPAIECYVEWLARQKYAARNVFIRVPLLMQFGEFAKTAGASSWEELPTHVESFVETWLRRQRREYSESDQKPAARNIRNPIWQLLRLILPNAQGYNASRHDLRITKAQKAEPFAEIVPNFFEFLRRERGLREGTIVQYRHYLQKLEDYLRKINRPLLPDLPPKIVTAFITKSGEIIDKRSVQSLCSILKAFFRYLYRVGLTQRDLSKAIESPRRYRLASLPRSITWKEVEQMLKKVDRRSGTGRRDYAILMLLVRYGLRAGEVGAMTLDDIDWKHNRLQVPGRKAGHSTVYPLATNVGEAILDYLKQGRPETTQRALFFAALAPYKPLSSAAVSLLAKRYLRKAGIVVPRPGSHTLRHTCVQRLVDSGFSLKTIGDYVGHRTVDATKIYTKINIERLREVALGVGEEVL
jgi:site-specific recombinase XerD